MTRYFSTRVFPTQNVLKGEGIVKCKTALTPQARVLRPQRDGIEHDPPDIKENPPLQATSRETSCWHCLNGKKKEPWSLRKYLPNHSKWPSLLTIHSAQPPRRGTTYVRVHVLKIQPWLPSDKITDHRELHMNVGRIPIKAMDLSYRSSEQKKPLLLNTNAHWGIISSIHEEHAWVDRCKKMCQKVLAGT